MEELEKHNTAGDLWIAVEGSVFDMTKCVQPLNFSSFWTFLLLLLLFLTFFLFFFFFYFFFFFSLFRYHLNHPGFGGPGIILKNAGGDATHGFKHAKHSPKAVGIRDALKIGEVSFWGYFNVST